MDLWPKRIPHAKMSEMSFTTPSLRNLDIRDAMFIFICQIQHQQHQRQQQETHLKTY